MTKWLMVAVTIVSVLGGMTGSALVHFILQPCGPSTAAIERQREFWAGNAVPQPVVPQEHGL